MSDEYRRPSELASRIREHLRVEHRSCSAPPVGPLRAYGCPLAEAHAEDIQEILDLAERFRSSGDTPK